MSDSNDDREAVGELRRIIGANDNSEMSADTLTRVCWALHRAGYRRTGDRARQHGVKPGV